MSETITLKSHIPLISYKSVGILSKKERNLSKFFRCLSPDGFDSPKKCFWSGNDVNQFRLHVQSSHQKVLCSFCSADKSPDHPMPQLFAAEDVDKLIEHLLEVHGKREYQCNRCQYRAKTVTHVQMHQISTHFDLWYLSFGFIITFQSYLFPSDCRSLNNSQLGFSKTLEDINQDICKIIICKPILLGPKDDPIVWLPRSHPNLDIDADDDKFYCLHCPYNNTEVMKVFVHSIHTHCDRDICIYNRNSEDIKGLEFVGSQSEEISSDSENEEPEVDNCQPLVKGFDTKLSLQANPDIPGLDKRFDTREKQIRKPFKRQPSPLPIFKGEEDSNDDFCTDDFEVGFGLDETFAEGYDEPLLAQDSSQILPQVVGNHNIGQIFASSELFDSSPLPCPLASTPFSTVTPLPAQPNTNQAQNQRNQSQNSKQNVQKKGKKLKPNEVRSDMNYRQYKERKRMEELLKTPFPANKNSGSTSQLPPEIDLRPYAKELKKSGLDKNSFKKIDRVGVQTNSVISYVTREEDTFDEYVNEIKVPKRGLKARFEGQSHFELITPTTIANKDKHLWKCILCSDGDNVFHLRETNIKAHLRVKHNTDSSFKCGHTGCDFIGQKPMITGHSKLRHPNEETRIEKFIVHCTQTQSIGITSGSHLQKAKTTARKSTTNNSHTTKGSKGALTQLIRESTFLGPLKNDTTGRKRSMSQSHEPYERIHHRGVHSSDTRSYKLKRTDSRDESENELSNGMDSESETESMDIQVESLPTKQAVAKKSTSKPSSVTQNISITLEEENIPTKYFCVFCNEGYVINSQVEAIEHYKQHLELGYICNQCDFKCCAYASMDQHFKLSHNSAEPDFQDNIPQVMNNWIIRFLENQIKSSDFTQNAVPNNSGINMVCPMCEKAATICRMKPRAFDALWKVKLHICKHMDWLPMQCNMCDTKFPDNPYLLMKHLVDFHLTSCNNLFNISFRGQKPYNEIKREQLRLIERSYTYDQTSIIINRYFTTLMQELDVNYENQLKMKFKLHKEVQVRLERCVVVKTEPVCHQLEATVDHQTQETDTESKTAIKDEDKKDIKHVLKSEVKSEIKNEVKDEVKNELKTEIKEEIKEESKETKTDAISQSEANGTVDNDDGCDLLNDIYGITGDCIVLSSDEDE